MSLLYTKKKKELALLFQYFWSGLCYVEQKLSEQFPGYVLTLFLRYSADILGIANCTVEELQVFIFSFSTFHPALEYTHLAKA